MNVNFKFDMPFKTLLLMFTLFIIASAGDVITTYIGLTSGFAEQTEFVDMLWKDYGLVGLILSKFIALFGMMALALPFYFFEKKMTMYYLATLYLMGAIVFGYATIHNLNLLGYL